MSFEFATTTRIIFGAGKLEEIGPLAKQFGHRPLLVTGRDQTRATKVVGLLSGSGIASVIFPVPGEPEIETVQRGLALAKSEHCDVVIGIGGGSALDAGKAIAALLNNAGDLLDYLEVIGHAKPLPQPSAPFIAIPTTAGTGSEVTRNAVLASAEHRVKVSLRSPHMLPRIALIDPELTYDLPPAITARTGMDALTQLIEPLVCLRANPLTDALGRECLGWAGRSLAVAFRDGKDPAARADMAFASLCGGLALANAGLGVVHGFAGPIGGMFAAPHGAICGALLSPGMEGNIRALQQRQPESEALGRYDEIGRLLTGKTSASPEDGVAWIRALVTELQIPRLGSYGITREHTAELVQKASESNSMKANPIALTPDELASILEAAL
jgi:alcohol dehydrogenase class IV